MTDDDVESMEMSGYSYKLTSAGLLGIESSRNISLQYTNFVI